MFSFGIFFLVIRSNLRESTKKLEWNFSIVFVNPFDSKEAVSPDNSEVSSTEELLNEASSVYSGKGDWQLMWRLLGSWETEIQFRLDCTDGTCSQSDPLPLKKQSVHKVESCASPSKNVSGSCKLIP